MNQKGFVNIGLVLLIIILTGVAGYLTLAKNPPQSNPIPNPVPTPTVCTQEAKECPDGSYVSRVGPNCEFALCTNPPAPIPLPKPISLQRGQRDGSFLLEEIYFDHVVGLNFAEYPVPTNKGYPVTLRIGQDVSNGCTVTLKLIKIEGDTAIFDKKIDSKRPCPICLAGATLIDTPLGRLLVKDLAVGMPIWTSDKAGHRVSAVVSKTSKVPVPSSHQMIHLVFDDGRELFASPGHPTIDGRTVGDLSPGDVYDGASVVTAKRILYGERATYDVLPSGETGFYWANGVLLGSTLSRR